MRTLLSRAVFVILLVLPAAGWARSKSGSVHVHGYTTRSGHYVAPYTRSAPHTYHAPALPRVYHPSTRSTSLTSRPSTRAAIGASRDSHGRISGARRPSSHSSATTHAPRPGRPRARVRSCADSSRSRSGVLSRSSRSRRTSIDARSITSSHARDVARQRHQAPDRLRRARFTRTIDIACRWHSSWESESWQGESGR